MNRCRLYPRPAPPDFDLIGRLKALPAPVVSDQMNRFGALNGLRPLPGMALEPRLAGPALTVRTRPGDNLVVHKAIDLAEPGEVLVIDAGGHIDRAVMGEIVYQHAVRRGVAGLVIDGAVRDAAEISHGPAPVFCRGITHLGPYKSGPGEIFGPVAVGGAAIRSGDLLVGDNDGVVVVPREIASQVAAGGEQQLEREETMLEGAKTGTLDRGWIDAALKIDAVRFE